VSQSFGYIPKSGIAGSNGPLIVFINKVLLKHSFVHLFMASQATFAGQWAV
jgi:hypothetical protein